MEGICYIIGAGQVDVIALTKRASDYVIAADAGYLHLNQLGVAADLVVGDFDSMIEKPDHPNLIEFPREKDKTDMVLAIDEGLSRGYKTLVILGGLGGRLDHTFANIQALSYIAESGARGYLLGDGMAVSVIKNSSIFFNPEKKGLVSVFCAGDTARGVTIRGLKYVLTDEVLHGTLPIGVSNEFTGAASEITVASGSLAVMWEENAAGVIDNLI